jgi:hypothetical protein
MIWKRFLSRERPRAAFFFFNPSMFRGTLEVAAALGARKGYECVLCCPVYLPETERYRAECDAAGVRFVCGMTPAFRENDMVEDLAARYSSFDRSRMAAARAQARRQFDERGIAGARSAACLARVDRLERYAAARGATLDAAAKREYENRVARDVEYWINLYFHLLREACGTIGALDARILVSAEENVDYNSAVFIEAIHRMGRPAACFSTALATAKEAAAYFSGRVEHRLGEGDFARFFRLAFPGWVHEFEGRQLTRFPLARAVAMELCELAPRHPWIINTGSSELLAVESEFARELFHDLGAETFPGRVRALGHPALDELHRGVRRAREIRREACKLAQCDPERPIVLFSVPTDQFATTPAPGFATYEDLLDHWVDSMRHLRRCAALVTVHPMLSKAHVERLRARGARVIEKPAAQLLPACDVFVASMSTTIKWARAIGKPVLNYDCYRMKYDPADRKSYLDGFPHVHVVREPADYLAWLDRIDRDEERSAMTSAAREGAAYWGEVDGHALDRIGDAFHRLALEGEPVPLRRQGGA